MEQQTVRIVAVMLATNHVEVRVYYQELLVVTTAETVRSIPEKNVMEEMIVLFNVNVIHKHDMNIVNMKIAVSPRTKHVEHSVATALDSGQMIRECDE